MSKQIFDTTDIRKIEELMEIEIIDDRFKCQQCTRLILNPKSCNKCNFNFCSKCYQPNNPKCQICHSELIETDQFIKNILLIQPIKCPYNCDNLITLLSLDFHIKICNNRVQKCIYKNCEFQQQKIYLEDHFKEAHKDQKIFDCQKCTVSYLGTERHDCIKNLKNLIKSQKDQIYYIISQLQASKVMIHNLNTEIQKIEKEQLNNEAKQENQKEIVKQCIHKHELTWIAATRNVKCQSCQTENKIARYMCKECQGYYCQKCVPPKFTKKHTCPDGHQLKFEQQPGQGVSCDFCLKYPYQEDLTVLSDRQCDFDVCYTCFTKKEYN